MILSCFCSVVCSEEFLHPLVVFPDRSCVELMWLPLPPSTSSVVICWWSLCWWVSSSSSYPGVHSFHLLFFVISWRGKAKWFKSVGVYSMIFEVSTSREEGDLLDTYNVNRDMSPD